MIAMVPGRQRASARVVVSATLHHERATMFVCNIVVVGMHDNDKPEFGSSLDSEPSAVKSDSFGGTDLRTTFTMTLRRCCSLSFSVR